MSDLNEVEAVAVENVRELMREGAHLVPGHMLDAVERYLINGIPPGSFLRAVISNDLREACSRADDENARALHDWVRFFYNYTPGTCWGSLARYDEWIEAGGWIGSYRAHVRRRTGGRRMTREEALQRGYRIDQLHTIGDLRGLAFGLSQACARNPELHDMAAQMHDAIAYTLQGDASVTLEDIKAILEKR